MISGKRRQKSPMRGISQQVAKALVQASVTRCTRLPLRIVATVSAARLKTWERTA